MTVKGFTRSDGSIPVQCVVAADSNDNPVPQRVASRAWNPGRHRAAGSRHTLHRELTEEIMKMLKTVVMLMGLVATSISFAQTSYPLVCRGGGDLYFNYTPFSNFSQNPQIWISFQRGSQKAGSNWENINALMPGQCSWLDRTVSNDEPDRIIIKDVRNFSISWSQGRVAGISSELTYLNMLRDPNHYQSFDVYNDRKGNFIVTRIGQSR